MLSVIEPVRPKAGPRQEQVNHSGQILTAGRRTLPFWSLPADERDRLIGYYAERAADGLPLFTDPAGRIAYGRPHKPR